MEGVFQETVRLFYIETPKFISVCPVSGLEVKTIMIIKQIVHICRTGGVYFTGQPHVVADNYRHGAVVYPEFLSVYVVIGAKIELAVELGK